MKPYTAIVCPTPDAQYTREFADIAAARAWAESELARVDGERAVVAETKDGVLVWDSADASVGREAEQTELPF